ncbi:MAG: hypothetical protein F6K16_36215 [Symploca sp. SIO2B6]|nr:hypothetical protein [Symploca sp. SIO2B6]
MLITASIAPWQRDVVHNRGIEEMMCITGVVPFHYAYTDAQKAIALAVPR